MPPATSCLLLVCVTGFAAATLAAKIAVHLTRSGGAFQVNALTDLEGAVARTWYYRLAH
jgi:hypothetical protein